MIKQNEDQLAKLREKLEALETDLRTCRAMIETLNTKSRLLATQRSDCLKIIAKLTIAKVEAPNP